MDNSISIIFETPKHVWLPVDFIYKDFHLDFEASDVLNDPIEELFHTITTIQDNEITRVTWWLEPGAYFIDFEKRGQDLKLTIIETDDLHNENADKTQLIKIIGNDKEIFEPIRVSLRQFSSKTYKENNWTFSFDKDKIQGL